MPTLGLNVDHIATLRQARAGREPDPVQAAVIAELAGAKGITAHLREDRRHIQDRDITLLRQTVATHLNLEMACTQEMVSLAIEILPFMCTIVPEKRQERTTEGGLRVRENERELGERISAIQGHNIFVSLFVDPDLNEVKAAKRIGASHIELHTGYYANATGQAAIDELERLKDMAFAAQKLGLRVNAGHGLDYRNVSPVAAIPGIEELNIGFSIVGRAVLVGLDTAVRDMVALL